MKNVKQLAILMMMFTLSTGTALTLLSCSTEKQTTEKPAVKESWSKVSVDAKVVGVNKKKREVTLQRKDGEQITISVSDEVKRFNEIKKGDRVKAEYWTFLRAEFREPTAEEIKNPLVVVTEEGRAPKENAPAGAVGAVVKAVVKVTGIDKENRQATIVGPRGNKFIVPVMDDAVLNNLKIGEQVIMTYAEAMAVSLMKQKK